jgi:BASS family bile acid:Na+ symporter
MTALAWIGKHATILLAAGVFVGLALPDLATMARPLLVPTIIVMLVFSLLRLQPAAILDAARSPGRVLPVVGFVLLVSPALGWAGVALFGVEEMFGLGVAAAVVVWTASPPLVSVTALATILRLDGALALMVMTLGGLLMPLTLPPLILSLIGLDLHIGVGELMLRLVGMLALAAFIAAAIRAVAGQPRIQRYSDALDGAFVLVMLIFAIAVMDGVTGAAMADPAKVAGMIALVFAVSLILQAIGFLVFLPAGRRTATTVALISGNRNMAIVLGAAPAAFHPDAFLYLAVLQFPIYLLPALLRPVYRRLST